MSNVVNRISLSCFALLSFVSIIYADHDGVSQSVLDVNTTLHEIPFNFSRQYMERWNYVKYERNAKKKDEFRNVFADLMKGYNKALNPAVGTLEEFQLISLLIQSTTLVEINEVEDRMSTIMEFGCLWSDDRLALKSYYIGDIEYGMPLDEDLVWKPTLHITNPQETRRSSNKVDIDSSLYLYIQQNGLLLWSFTRAIETRCKINTRYYPFDRQVCNVELSFNVPYNMLALQLATSIEKEELESGNWKCTNYSVYQYINRKLDQYYHARIEFVFKRKPMRPALIFILPLFLLVLLSPLVFLLPADTNDRVGLAVTVLLATSVYMTLVADKLPDSSDPIPIIIIVFFLWFIYNGLIVALVLLNLEVFYKDEKNPVPGCLQRFVSFINRVYCTKPKQDDSSKSGITDKMSNDGDDSEPVKHYEDKFSDITWRDVSKALDKILLVTMYGIKIGFDVTIFLILYTGDDDKTGEEQIYDRDIIEYIYGNRDSMRPYRY